MSRTGLLVAFALLAVSFGALGTAEAAVEGPVVIVGDAQLLQRFAPDEPLKGTTAADPIRITGVTASAVRGAGIDLSHTRRHVVIEGAHVTTSYDGVRLLNVTNVTVTGSTFENNRQGIHVSRSTDVRLVGNTIKASSDSGVFLDGSTGVTLEDNRISVSAKDVRFKNAPRNVLRNNNLSTATGQWGLYFDDNASYENDIPTSNVVNHIPVQWYANVSGTAEAPLVIRGAAVDLRGITNVAQIVLHQVSHVRVEAPVAKSGGAAGILVMRSDNVTLASPVAEKNVGQGIEVQQSADVRVHDGSARQNDAGGILVRNAYGSTIVRGTTVSENARIGIQVQLSRGVHLSANTISANQGAEGIALSGSEALVTANVVSQQAKAVAFAASSGSTFRENRITIAAGQFGFHFDGVASYDNAIDPSNTVNGVPVRWYANAAGASESDRLVLSGIDVPVPGITNVAQVMLYRASNVTLASPAASNGTAAGILVQDSYGVTLTSPSAIANAQQGIVIRGSQAVALGGLQVERNKGDGLLVTDSVRVSAESGSVQANGARGVAAERSPGTTFRGLGVLGNTGAGIQVTGSSGALGSVIENSILDRNGGGGISVTSSHVGSVRGNRVNGSGLAGIALNTLSAGALVENNVVENQTRALQLTRTSGATVSGNTIRILPGQTGLWFDDAASYDNVVASSNLVNGVAVRWYVNITATAAAPVSLPPMGVELPGITNVAQVMLYRVHNASADVVLATNGTARGVYVLDSSNVTLQGALAENNTLAGIAVDRSPDTRLDRARALANRGAGLTLDKAPRAAVVDGHVANNTPRGLSIATSPAARVATTTLRDNGPTGILLDNPGAGVALHANTLVNHTRNVELRQAAGGAHTANTIEIAPGQTGWHFYDEPSYGAAIDTTNKVNGVAVRWYANLHATASNPLVLADFSVELANITNVAQVMLAQSTHVTLRNVTATNGSYAGILVHRSSDVTIRDSFASGNGHGIMLNATLRPRVEDTHASANRGDGVLALGAAGAQRMPPSHEVALQRVSASGNGGHGANLEAATGTTRVASSTFLDNGGAGVRLRSVASAVVESTNMSQNRGAGLHVDTMPAGMRAEGNALHGNLHGIRLTKTEYGEYRDNVLSIRDGQTGLWFDDETSYNNVIPATNTVNGVPIRWYTILAGSESAPVVLAGDRVELANITNVAQVMVYKSAYVRMSDIVATNGTARGVYLWQSSSIQLRGATVSGSERGVHLHLTQSSTVEDLVANDTVDAVRLSDSLSNTIRRVDAPGAIVGVNVTDGRSKGNHIEQITVSGTTAKGVRDDGSPGGRGHNLIADAGANKRIKVGAVLNFTDALAAWRSDSERAATYSWQFGDGNASTQPKPGHAYAVAGPYVVNYSFTTADGKTLRDRVHVDVVPPLSAPRLPTVATGDKNATLAWLAPEHDGGSPVLKYRIYRAELGGTPKLLVELGNVTHHFDKGLVNGRTYVYEVAAVNADGEGPRAQAAAVPASVPGAPGGLKLVGEDRRVLLSWSAPADTGGIPLTGYAIHRGLDGAPLVHVATLDAVTSYEDGNLTNGVTYRYAVRALNAIGPGPLSANATVKPTGPPSAPQNLRALPADSSVVLAWLPPADDGGAAITGYRLYRGVDPNNLAPVRDLGLVLAFSDTGLANGRTYHYALAALNAKGAGDRTAALAATPTDVDDVAPVLLATTPDDGARIVDARPEVRARYIDNLGVVTASVRFTLDGQPVAATVSANEATYRPPRDLAPGLHRVTVEVEDAAGNAAKFSWSFRVLATSERVPILEYENLTVEPASPKRGERVAVTVTVRNVGFAEAMNESAALRADNRTLSTQTFDLAVDEERVLTFQTILPVPGNQTLSVGEATLDVHVQGAPPAPADGGDGGTEAPGEEPQMPPKGIPGTGLGAALAAALVAALAMRGRRRA